MARSHLINAACAGFTALLAAVLYWYVIPSGVALPRFRLGSTSTLVTPRLLPQLYALLLLGVSLTHLAIALLRSNSGAARAPVEPWPAALRFRALAAILMVSIYILLAIEALGFYTATGLALALGCPLLGERSTVRILAVSLLVPATLYLLFERLFNLFLPRGLIF